jgi:hypothetical protein
LGARLDGIEEVVGSNPIGSTIFLPMYFLYILQSETTAKQRYTQRAACHKVVNIRPVCGP